MPAVSEAQRRLFQMALAAKRGHKIPAGPAKKIASSVPESSIKHFTGPVKKGKK